MKKICYVVTIPLTIRSFFIPQLRYLSENGFDVTVICSDDGKIKDELGNSVKFIPVDIPRGLSFAGSIAAIWKLKKVFQTEKFDLIQYSTPNASLYASIAARMVGCQNRNYHLMGLRYLGASGVLYAFEHGENGDLLIMKAPACSIGLQAEAVCEMFGGNKDDIKVIGIRHGEKMYETLLTNEECAKAIDLGGFYRVPADNRTLNYDKYFKDGDSERNTLTEFNSNNTKLLNKEEIKAKMMELTYIQERLAEE